MANTSFTLTRMPSSCQTSMPAIQVCLKIWRTNADKCVLMQSSCISSGKRIDFMASAALTQQYADQVCQTLIYSKFKHISDSALVLRFLIFQFAGFRGAFDCNLEAPFAATIFRLPLRTSEQALTSRLSSSVPDMQTLQQHVST